MLFAHSIGKQAPRKEWPRLDSGARKVDRHGEGKRRFVTPNVIRRILNVQCHSGSRSYLLLQTQILPYQNERVDFPKHNTHEEGLGFSANGGITNKLLHSRGKHMGRVTFSMCLHGLYKSLLCLHSPRNSILIHVWCQLCYQEAQGAPKNARKWILTPE